MATNEERIFGLHTVAEALRAGEPVHRLIIGKHRQSDAKIAPLIAEAKRRNIPVLFQSHAAFADLSNRNHQFVVAALSPFRYFPFPDVRSAVREAKTTLIVALDHLEDPQNVGALLRNAEGAGADAIVMPERRNAGITASVRRAAAGAASHLKVARVPNLVSALEGLKADGCWVTGLAAAGQASDYYRTDYTNKPVIVVGAEGKGLSRLVSERCDALVRIPQYGRVSSLNAASAAAVVLFEVARRLRETPVKM